MTIKEKCLFTLLLALTGTHSYSTENRDLHMHDHASAERNYDSRSIMHNVTMDCGDIANLYRSVATCQRGLWQLVVKGNVWLFPGIQGRVGNSQNARNFTDNLMDSLDSLDHACYIQERSRKCMEEHGVGDYCLSTVNGLDLEMNFQFVCQHQQRDENLIRSLQCLRDNRLLVMLFFHIANHCFRGQNLLDDVMRRIKNAHFYMLDINPPTKMPHVNTPLYCLPMHVISTCVTEIVEDHCGKRSSELVQNYLLYLQDRFNHSLKSAGLSSNICDYKTHSNFALMMPLAVASERHNKLDFVKGLKIAAPGTALDTVLGRTLVAALETVSLGEVCSTAVNAYGAYTACVMLSDDKYERNKFNILQFGQELFPFIYHGTHCLRLEQFTACWKLLQGICGPTVRGYAQHATLLVEGCKLQSEMDTAGCHWQDMLIGRYIQASRVTIWPVPEQGLLNPLLLESTPEKNRVMNDLDTVIALLHPGVEEILKKCGQKPAKHLQGVLQQLQYLQYDALKVANQLFNNFQHLF